MKPLRDVDSAERAFQLKAYGWSMGFGVVGMLLGFVFGDRLGIGALAAMVLGFVLFTFLAGFAATRLADAAARVARSIYLPSGASTPAARDYSLADALAIRGRFFDAADELQRCAALQPQDLEPKLRLARLYRDELQQPEDAVAWFKRALEVEAITAGSEQAVLRELIEVYTHRLRRPHAAMPWLARLAARHRGTPSGEWARRELAELKKELRES